MTLGADVFEANEVDLAFSLSCDWRMPGLFGHILCKCVDYNSPRFSATLSFVQIACV